MRPQVGQLINNKYRLLRLIGDGGMGSVFEARHEVLATSVALKFLHPELSRRQGLVQRFLQEARVSARIQSPHVVRVTDVEQTSGGLAFIVMEYLRGTSLQTLYEDLYKEGKRLSYEEALNYALQMLDGLEAAHDEGIIHRDLKPDNVMITKGKRGEPLVKLLDFGIAKLKINGELYKGLTRPGVIMGTPEYMAPEQVFSADQVDVRADIFSCGVMFFEMFAGRRPVGGDEPHQIAAQYLAGSVARLTELAPHVPRELAAIIHRAMLPDPKDRFATVADFRAAMERFKTTGAGDRGISTPPPAQVGATPHSDRSSERPSPDESRRSVPKTIPPSDDVHAEGAHVDGGTTEKVSEPFGASSGADPLSSDRAIASAAIASKHNAQNGTSVMGAPAHEQTFDGPFGLDQHRGQNGSSYAGHAAIAKSSGGVTPPGVAVPPSRAGSAANLMESTLEGAPFFPGATEGYQALDLGVTPRPGGTNIGAGVVPGTASYDATAGQSAMHANYASTPALSPPVRPRKKGGIFGILFAATAVAVLAVGGVWALRPIRAQRRQRQTPQAGRAAATHAAGADVVAYRYGGARHAAAAADAATHADPDAHAEDQHADPDAAAQAERFTDDAGSAAVGHPELVPGARSRAASRAVAAAAAAAAHRPTRSAEASSPHPSARKDLPTGVASGLDAARTRDIDDASDDHASDDHTAHHAQLHVEHAGDGRSHDHASEEAHPRASPLGWSPRDALIAARVRRALEARRRFLERWCLLERWCFLER